MTDLQHRRVREETLPGQEDGWICELDDQDWPCDYERDLSREDPNEEVKMMTSNLYEDGDLLTPTKVAEMFAVDPKTVTRWSQAGKLPSIRTLGGHRRYKYSDVREALEAARKP